MELCKSKSKGPALSIIVIVLKLVRKKQADIWLLFGNLSAKHKNPISLLSADVAKL